MHLITRAILAIGLMIPIASQAVEQISNCVTLVGVSNYMAYNNDNLIILVTSPAIPGCGYNGVPGAVGISVGQLGVSATNISTFLASALTAYSSGHQVQIYYDTTSCFANIIFNGGQSGDCP